MHRGWRRPTGPELAIDTLQAVQFSCIRARKLRPRECAVRNVPAIGPRLGRHRPEGRRRRPSSSSARSADHAGAAHPVLPRPAATRARGLPPSARRARRPIRPRSRTDRHRNPAIAPLRFGCGPVMPRTGARDQTGGIRISSEIRSEIRRDFGIPAHGGLLWSGGPQARHGYVIMPGRRQPWNRRRSSSSPSAVARGGSRNTRPTRGSSSSACVRARLCAPDPAAGSGQKGCSKHKSPARRKDTGGRSGHSSASKRPVADGRAGAAGR